MTVSRAQVPTHRGHQLSAYFNCSQAQVYGSPQKLSIDLRISLQWF